LTPALAGGDVLVDAAFVNSRVGTAIGRTGLAWAKSCARHKELADDIAKAAIATVARQICDAFGLCLLPFMGNSVAAGSWDYSDRMFQYLFLAILEDDGHIKPAGLQSPCQRWK